MDIVKSWLIVPTHTVVWSLVLVRRLSCSHSACLEAGRHSANYCTDDIQPGKMFTWDEIHQECSSPSYKSKFLQYMKFILKCEELIDGFCLLSFYYFYSNTNYFSCGLPTRWVDHFPTQWRQQLFHNMLVCPTQNTPHIELWSFDPHDKYSASR